MTGASFQSDREHDGRPDARHDVREPGPKSSKYRKRCETPVLELEHVQLPHTETLRGAFGLEPTRVRERLARRNARVFANALGSVGRDDEMHLASRPRQTMEQGTDNAFVVRMREHREDGSVLREQCGRREQRDERDDEQWMHDASMMAKASRSGHPISSFPASRI